MDLVVGCASAAAAALVLSAAWSASVGSSLRSSRSSKRKERRTSVARASALFHGHCFLVSMDPYGLKLACIATKMIALQTAAVIEQMWPHHGTRRAFVLAGTPPPAQVAEQIQRAACPVLVATPRPLLALPLACSLTFLLYARIGTYNRSRYSARRRIAIASATWATRALASRVGIKCQNGRATTKIRKARSLLPKSRIRPESGLLRGGLRVVSSGGLNKWFTRGPIFIVIVLSGCQFSWTS